MANGDATSAFDRAFSGVSYRGESDQSDDSSLDSWSLLRRLTTDLSLALFKTLGPYASRASLQLMVLTSAHFALHRVTRYSVLDSRTVMADPDTPRKLRKVI